MTMFGAGQLRRPVHSSITPALTSVTPLLPLQHRLSTNMSLWPDNERDHQKGTLTIQGTISITDGPHQYSYLSLPDDGNIVTKTAIISGGG